jgi:hypothetical protein
MRDKYFINREKPLLIYRTRTIIAERKKIIRCHCLGNILVGNLYGGCMYVGYVGVHDTAVYG